MTSYAQSIYDRQPSNNAVIVVDGDSATIKVNRHHLIIEDGLGSQRRLRRIARVSDTRRILILGSSGYITLDAFRWCSDLGICISQIDRDGKCIMSTPGSNGDARLRTAQAIAQPGERNEHLAKEIMCYLISEKISGQNQITNENLLPYLIRIEKAKDIATILSNEGSAAFVYWNAISKINLKINWLERQTSIIPESWQQSFKTRTSEKNQRQGKNATHPINAMLNYGYAIAESEARIAAQVNGLDPQIGFGHNQYRKSDSLAHDLMEPLRPLVDQAISELITSNLDPNGKPNRFNALYFAEDRTGVIRIVPPLTHWIAERVIAATSLRAGQVAEHVTRMLADSSRWDVTVMPWRSRPECLSVTERPLKLAVQHQAHELLPDAVWQLVAPYMPAERARTDGRHKTVQADSRSVLAGIVAHERYGVAWRDVPARCGVAGETCRRRMISYQASGIWTEIKEALGIT